MYTNRSTRFGTQLLPFSRLLALTKENGQVWKLLLSGLLLSRYHFLSNILFRFSEKWTGSLLLLGKDVVVSSM